MVKSSFWILALSIATGCSSAQVTDIGEGFALRCRRSLNIDQAAQCELISKAQGGQVHLWTVVSARLPVIATNGHAIFAAPIQRRNAGVKDLGILIATRTNVADVTDAVIHLEAATNSIANQSLFVLMDYKPERDGLLLHFFNNKIGASAREFTTWKSYSNLTGLAEQCVRKGVRAKEGKDHFYTFALQ